MIFLSQKKEAITYLAAWRFCRETWSGCSRPTLFNTLENEIWRCVFLSSGGKKHDHQNSLHACWRYKTRTTQKHLNKQLYTSLYLICTSLAFIRTFEYSSVLFVFWWILESKTSSLLSPINEAISVPATIIKHSHQLK
jgi:hypothetical protein